MGLARARWATWVAAMVGVANPASAQQFDASRFLPTAGSCPSARAIWSAILEMVPHAWPKLLEAKARASVVESGDSYRVIVTTDSDVVERSYSDEARDCAQRAQYAATFIVLALMPPQVDGNRPSTPSAQPSPAAPATAPSQTAPSSVAAPSAAVSATSAASAAPLAPTGRPAAFASTGRPAAFARIEIGAVGALSPPVAEAPRIAHWGAAARARLGSGALAATFTVSYWPSTDFRRHGVDGSHDRIPMQAGVRLTRNGRWLDAGIDLGVVLSVERFRGRGLHETRSAEFVSAGVGVGAVLSPKPVRGFAPFLELGASFFPVARELVALPQGAFAATPRLWLAASIGMALDI